MLRFCSLLALVELTLVAACVGLPSAYADPAEQCCADNMSSRCNGCLGGYNVDSGVLYGCMDAGRTFGCEMYSLECAFLEGPVAKYAAGSNCSVFLEMNEGGFSVMGNGCGGFVECD